MHTETAAYDRMARAIRYLDEHYADRPGLVQMASAAGLSPFHFSREFRRWTGLAPTQYLKQLALDAAKAELESRGTVIAAACAGGLSGGGRLHDLFVTLDAVTPGEFKSGGAGLQLAAGMAETPFGRALLAWSTRGLMHLSFADDAEPAARRNLLARWPNATWRDDDEGARQLVRRIFGGGTGEFKLLVQGTNFQVQVWRALLDLGARGATTYGDLAARIGRPRATRAVGTAVGDNPVAWLIPCHRVLRKDGGLGGYRWGMDRKRAILAWEMARLSA